MKHICIISIIILLSACNQHKYENLLNKAETQLVINPDSALKILKEIPTKKINASSNVFKTLLYYRILFKQNKIIMPDLGEGAGGSILDLLEDSDYPTPEGFYDNNNTGNDNNTGDDDDDSSTVLDPPSPPTTGDPEETCDDPCACWGECGDDNDDNDDYGDETPIPKEKDCAGVEDGKAYFDDCEECVGGTTGKQPCKESPCEKVNRLLQNEQINKQYKQLLEKAKNKATKEWGTEIVAHFNDINNWLNVTGAYSIKSPEIREGNDHSFELNWKDDSKAFNRMLGYMHTHPTAGTCFSPGDINKFISLKDSPTTLERMFEDAMCMAITPDSTYILTVKDWGKLSKLSDEDLISLEEKCFKEYLRPNSIQEKSFIEVYIKNTKSKGLFNLTIKSNNSDSLQHISFDAKNKVIINKCK